MHEDIVIIIASAVTGIAAMGTLLAGLHMWLKARAQRLGGAVREDLDDLRAAVAQLRSDVEHTCGELNAGQQELHERIDFAERLLSRGKSPPM